MPYMTDATARWIRATFAVVPDVSRASIDPDPSVIYKTHHADVVISTWMGARLYVYLIKKAPKVRELKSILRDNSRSSIGTLFLVDRDLLPIDDSHVKMQDWWDALASLNNDYFYTYFLADNEIHITQAHFTAVSGKDDYRVWYLPEFSVEKVTVRRREITHGNVRGRWHLGDIASPDYKRRMGDERVNQRFHYRTKYTQEIPNSNKDNLNTDALRNIKLKKYYKMIGVNKGASEKEIKTAFRQMAMKVHPDVSALPRQEADKRIKQLNEAYEYIKSYHGWA